MKKKNDWIKKGTLIIVLLVCIASYLWVPEIHKTMNQIFKMFASGDFTVVRDFVASYGVYAALMSFLLMIFQSIAAPLPAFLITFANASLFGWWKGAILSWSSAMAGAAVCFYIAKILGRDVAEKLTSKTGLEQIDTFFERYGKNTILICRLLPFVSFDIVSYAAGLTSMSFVSFFVATGIGQLPATIVYSIDFVFSFGINFYAEKDIYGQTVRKIKKREEKEYGNILQSGGSCKVWDNRGKSIRVGRKILCLLQCCIRRGCADCMREIIDRTCSGTYRTVPILY